MKIDLKKELPGYAARRGVFDDVDIQRRRYAMIDGEGDPNSTAAYRDAVATLYAFSFPLKFLVKKELGVDYVVGPLEALWWADDLAFFTAARDKKRWKWSVMIVVPDAVIEDQIDRACARAADKDAPAIGRLRIASVDEGRCVQTLHVGPYDDEGPVLARMHDEAIAGRGLQMRGHHHEIYLGDPRRTAPERLRTILRQPVTEAETS